MANTNYNSTIYLRKFQEIFHNKIKFAGLVDRQYDASFKSNGVSGKPGTSLRVRKPSMFGIRSGKVANVQDVVQDYTTITCSTQEGIDFAFTSEELTMNIDDLSKFVLEPAAARLASRIDSQGLAQYANVQHSVGDFTFDAADDILAAGEKLNNMACPEDGRVMVLSPKANRSILGAFTSVYNPGATISQQYKSGVITNGYGFDVYMSQNVNTHTCGTRVATDDQYGIASWSGATLTMDSAYAITWKAGDTITLDGIFDVNPETKQSLGYLKQWTVAADAATSATLTLSPTPVASTSPLQNYTGTINASGYVNVTGVASTAYYQNLAFHPSAFTLVTADLELPGGVDMAARETMDGVSMRFVRYYDGTNDTFVGRFDVYYGWTTLRPEWAVRIPSSVG